MPMLSGRRSRGSLELERVRVPDAVIPDAAIADAAVDVTVVIPAYNAAGFVDRAIGSALAQDGVTLEVVVVDDASTDGTANAITARYSGDPRVRVIRLDSNGGPSIARNSGFAAARGEWIAVLDADDAFDPGRLAHIVAAAQRETADVVADNVRFLDIVRDQLSEPMLKNRTTIQRLDVHTFLDGARPGTGEMDFGLFKPVFSRAFLRRHGLRYPPDIRHGEDFLLYFDILAASGTFIVLPEAGYRWTLRNSGQSRTRIDYAAQARDVARLRDRPDVRDDPRLVALLDKRARGLILVQEGRILKEALRERRYLRALAMCLKSPPLFRNAARFLLKGR
jgi:succinoglycan biosynthesis protein ExoO